MSRSALIVDDDPTFRRLANHLLQEMNFSVAEVDNGKAALDGVFAAKSLTLVLDWRMPILSGRETLIVADRVLQVREKFYKTHPIDLILYTATELELLRLPQLKKINLKGYVSKRWPIDVQIQKFKETIGGR